MMYALTIVYSFALAAGNYGYTNHVASYLAQRGGFYLGEMILLVVGWIRCSRLYSNFDQEYFNGTEKIFAAADTLFVLIAIVTVISAAAMLPIFIFLPKRIFEDGAASGLIVELLIVALVFVFYLLVMQRFDMVKRKKEEMKHPLGEKTEDFFAFIHGMDEKQEDMKKPTNDEIPDVSALLDETIPDEEEFQRHLQRISILSHNDDPVQLWECSFCGSLNPDGSRRCDFCGADCEQRKEDNDERL